MADTLTAGGHRPLADDYDGEATALESRADVASLEGLQHERRKLITENAALIARYGNFGMHDDFRKARVEAQKIKARMELSAGREKKPTESEIDAAAYGSEEYATFLDNALEEKIQWLQVNTMVEELNERIRDREAAIRAYTSEPK